MKKWIAMLVASLLMAGLCVFPAWAKEPAAVTADSGYSDEVKVLLALGIMTGDEAGEVDQSAVLTRAQSAVIMTRLLGLADKAAGRGSIFADVPDDHWAAGAINVLAELGMVAGDGENFRPDGDVTQQELIKMLVNVLGYGVQAEQRGGYPAGYMTTAAQLGILKGAEGTADTVSVGEAAKLIYRATRVDVMQQTGFGSMQEEYVTYEGQTLLTENLGIGMEKGVLLVTSTTSLLMGEPNREGYITIDSYTMPCDMQNVDALLGYAVEYYYRFGEGMEDTVLYMLPQSRNSAEEIDLSDVQDITRNSDLSLHLEYLTDGGQRTEEADIPVSVPLIYNGTYAEAEDGLLEHLQAQSGSLRLIDNDGDGETDVLFADAFEIMVIDSISVSESKVYDKISGDVLDLDDSSSSRSVSITLDGENVELAELFPGDLLQVYRPYREGKKSTIKVVVSLDNFDGEVEELSTDNKTLVINGVEYDTEPGYWENTDYVARLGEGGTFFLSTNGRIAHFVKDAYTTDLRYGFLLAVKPQSGLSDLLDVKLMDTAGDWHAYTTAVRVKLNGTTVDAPALLADDSPLTGDLNGVTRQLVRYRLNKDNELAELVTAGDEVTGEQRGFTLDLEKDGALYRMGNYFNSLYQVTASTPVFVVPADTIDGLPADEGILTQEDNYMVKTASYLDYGDGKNSYNIKIYDSDELYSVGALVVYSENVGTGSKADLMGDAGLAIERMAESVDADGNSRVKVYGVSGGQKVEYVLYDDGLADTNDIDTLKPADNTDNIYDDFPTRQLDPVTGEPVPNPAYDPANPKPGVQQYLPAKRLVDLRCGDVIAFQTNPQGEINSFLLLFHPAADGAVEFEKMNLDKPGDEIYSNMYIAYGEVERKGDGKFLLSIRAEGEPERIRAIPAAGSISKYNADKKTLTPASAADIVRGAKVFVRTVYGSNEAKDIVIYE